MSKQKEKKELKEIKKRIVKELVSRIDSIIIRGQLAEEEIKTLNTFLNCANKLNKYYE